MTHKRKLWYLAIVVVAMGLLFGYAHRRDLYGQYQAYVQSNEETGRLEESAQALREEREARQTRVEHLNNDPLEMEAAIRSGRDLVREDEHVLRIDVVETPGPER